MTTNIPIMKLKSLLTRTPPFHFPSQSPNFIRKAATFKPHNQNPNFIIPIPIPSLSLVDSCSKSLNLDQKRGMRTESGRSGEIHVIVGPMFAGKTTTLLKRMKLASSEGSSVIVIKSSKDSRYGLDSIVTHDGERLPCLPLAELSSFREKLGAEAYDKVDVIGIDEAQFFGDLYAFCSNAADLDGKTVVVAGLDGDYLRRSFGSVLDIIPIADTVTKLTARCEVCGQKAFFTLRKTDETKTELIAGADVYMPVCRKHYMSGQMVKDMTKTVIDSQTVQLTSVL